MLNTKSFLCLDFGAGSLKVAEFEPNEAGTLRLKQFGLKPLGFEGSQEAARERVILKAIQELFAERPFSSKNINVCAPGFHVFSKFVKLRSEEHTSELQSHHDLVCRLLLEKKKKNKN